MKAADVIEIENSRRRSDVWPSLVPAPTVFPALVRHEEAAKLLFEGLLLHYFECAAAGRLDIWKTAAHGCIDLLSSIPERFVKREEIGQ